MKPSVIVQFGVERSGTTLIYQILEDIASQFLGPDVLLKKTHNYRPELCTPDNLILCSFRDFRDVLVSLWKVHKKKENRGGSWMPLDLSAIDRSKYINAECGKTTLRITRSEIDNWAQYIKIAVSAMDKYRASSAQCVLLRYEDFRDNYGVIFTALENALDVVLNEEFRKEMSVKHSIESNKKIAEKFKHFGEYDKTSLIHGDHVYKGSIGGWKEFVPEDLHGYLESSLSDALKKWGYL